MTTLLEAINRFTFSRNTNLKEIKTYQLVTIQEMLKQKQVIPAIKHLRELTKTTVGPYLHMREGSSFVRFLNTNNISLAKETKLGLKEAKDIIDFVNENRELWV
jgi:ribosomal protein L7/L12